MVFAFGSKLAVKSSETWTFMECISELIDANQDDLFGSQKFSIGYYM